MSKRKCEQDEVNYVVKRQKTFNQNNYPDQDPDQDQDIELMNIQSSEMDCEQTVESPVIDFADVQIDESDINIQQNVIGSRCSYSYTTNPKNLMDPFSCKYCYHGISCLCDTCRFYMI